MRVITLWQPWAQWVAEGIDGIEQPEGIILFATTNYPNELSEALINRPGRFDRIFEMKPPELPQILKLLEYHKIAIKDGDLAKVAKELKSFSMAFVEEFVKSTKMTYKSNVISMSQAETILTRIHKHNDLYKNHFENEKSGIGFGKREEK